MEAILDLRVNNKAALTQIAQYNKEISELKDTQKALNKELKDGAISQEQYNDQSTAAEVTIRKNKLAIQTLNKEVKENIKYEKELEGSVNKLRVELNSLKRTYDELSESERNAASGVELQNKIKTLSTEVKGAEEATDRFSRNVGNYENAVRDVISEFVPFGGQIIQMSDNMTQFGDASVNGFQSAGASAKAFGKTLLSLLANPIFAAIAGVVGVGVAFKFWYDYNKGIEEATRLTQTFLGLQGGELKAMRAEISATAQVYDKDFKEVLTTVNTLSKQFGISSSEALELVNKGFASGADVQGTFTEGIKEYSTFFNQAGLSASEFIAISTEAQKQGIWSDKGIDAIKEADISIREMTDGTRSALEGIGIDANKVQADLLSGNRTTFDVIQEISQRLSELPANSAVVGTAVADIFRGAGEDAGLQYLTTLKDINTELDVTVERSGTLGKLQMLQLQSQSELNRLTAALFDQTGGSFEKLTTNSKIWLNNTLSKIIEGGINLINGVIKLRNESTIFRGIIAGLATTAKLAFAPIELLFKNFGNVLSLLGKSIQALFTLDFDTFKSAMSDYASSTITDLNSIKNEVVETFQNSFNAEIEPIEIPAIATVEVESDANGGNLQQLLLLEGKAASEQAVKELEAFEKQITELYDKAVGEISKGQAARAKEVQKDSEQTFKEIKENTAKENAELLKLTKEGAAERLQELANEAQKRVMSGDISQLESTRQYEADKLALILSYDSQTKNALYESDAAYQAAVIAARQGLADADAKIATQQQQNIQNSLTAAQTATSALAGLFETLAQDNEKFAEFAKALAIFEIAVNTAKALSAIPAMNAAGDPYSYPLRVAMGVGIVLSNIAQAYSVLNSAKQPTSPTFATGGMVYGAGSGTSDSINARLSNGESVNNAVSTSMFKPLYSTLNQMGGGVPFYNTAQSQGEDMLARAVAKGVATLDLSVSVEEINRVDSRVNVLENIRKI